MVPKIVVASSHGRKAPTRSVAPLAIRIQAPVGQGVFVGTEIIGAWAGGGSGAGGEKSVTVVTVARGPCRCCGRAGAPGRERQRWFRAPRCVAYGPHVVVSYAQRSPAGEGPRAAADRRAVPPRLGRRSRRHHSCTPRCWLAGRLSPYRPRRL